MVCKLKYKETWMGVTKVHCNVTMHLRAYNVLFVNSIEGTIR